MDSSKNESSGSSTYSATSFHNDLESLSEEEYFRYVGQYNCPCIGSVYGCPAMTNGTQYCYKYYCPYENEANKNNVFIEENVEKNSSKENTSDKSQKETNKTTNQEKKNKKIKSYSI